MHSSRWVEIVFLRASTTETNLSLRMTNNSSSLMLPERKFVFALSLSSITLSSVEQHFQGWKGFTYLLWSTQALCLTWIMWRKDTTLSKLPLSSLNRSVSLINTFSHKSKSLLNRTVLVAATARTEKLCLCLQINHKQHFVVCL